MKSTLNLRRVFISASILSLFIVEAFLWVQILSDIALRTGADFIAFYTAGRLAQTAGIANVYQPDRQRTIQQAQVGFELGETQVLLYNHLPFVIPLSMLAVDENFVASFMRWNAFMLIILCTATAWLASTLPGLTRSQTGLAVAGGLLFFPTCFSLLNGQDTALLFIGAVIGVWGLLTQRDAVAGLGMSITTLRPHIALALAIPFFFKRRKIFWGFALGAFALAALSLILIGENGTLDYLHILGLSAGGKWYGMKELEMFNLLGLLRRTLPVLNESIARGLAWSVYGLSILILSIVWHRTATLTEKELGVMMILAIFAAPHLHYHDLTLLLVPLFLALRIGLTRKLIAADTAAILPLSVALLFLVANLTPVLKYAVPYLFMIILLIALWKPEIFRYSSTPRKYSTSDSNL